ncbi:hypothetical protein Pse7367_1821 [Thalassoporum mexicanum PCC 7367]|uniref:PFE-CTERM domain-containing protein n=1 Tax=Thalassoporum mexicanum TaxID=3457544 RepID=UPI00029FAC3C|nr:hypothetical protein [Pseudanabaena sp. PCC 7367]AFY70097.1 hypothetical protein Pse7367_1821 [Pseudanabaena sp. PCC 7367]
MNRVLNRTIGIGVSAIATPIIFLAHADRSQAASFTLYDGTAQAVTPDNFAPQFLDFNPGLVPGATQTYSGGINATNLNTTASDGVQAGYTNFNLASMLVNPAFPDLDRTVGYTLSFVVEIVSAAEASADRAGFNVIAVSSDPGAGNLSSVEISFQTNRVFSQPTPDPNPAIGFSGFGEENTMFNPVGVGFVAYDLVVAGSTYELFANSASILSGPLRDYTPFAGFPDPYETANFIFFGDDTTSAQANINFQSATLTTIPFEFSPAFGLIALAGVAGLWQLLKLNQQKGKSLPIAK